MSPPQTHVGTLTPKDDGVKGGAFERCLSDEGGALTNGIGALMREAPESSLAPPTSRTQKRQQSGNLGEGPGQHLDLGLPSCQPWEK